MGSSGKRKTTMAKLNRERKLLERRRDKAARKDARRNAPPESEWDTEVGEGPSAADDPEGQPAAPDADGAPDGTAAPDGVGAPDGVAAPEPA
jgi:hypothetical protein